MGVDITKLIGNSKFFHWGEALYLPQLEDYHMPNAEEISNIQELCLKLDKVRAFIGQPFKVNCWIRPKHSDTHKRPGTDYNALVGGSKTSSHISGKAVDGTFLNMTVDAAINKLLPKLAEFQLSMEQNGSKFNRNWIHLQNLPMADGQYRVFMP